MADQLVNKYVDVQLVITLRQFETGAAQVLVAGPTHNKLMCAHMIADAFKAIMDKKLSPLTTPMGVA